MTTTENTTRPSNNTITRRKMLQSVAAASAVLPASIVPQAIGAPLANNIEGPSPNLLRLIDEHQWSLDAWETAGLGEGAKLDAEIAALNAILAYPIETIADLREKANYLLQYDHDQYQTDMLELLLVSMAGKDAKPRLQPVDPLIDAIAAYKSGLAAFDATPSAITELDEDRMIARTYGPAMDVLMEWDEPARTFAGAIAAIRMANEENITFSASVIAENMVRAALAYFSPRSIGSTALTPQESATLALYREWKARRDEDYSGKAEAEAQAGHQIYLSLQEQITSMKPITAQEMAAQLVVETDFGDSDYRKVFFERVVALAEMG